MSHKMLNMYARAYYNGTGLIDDATYDYLEERYGREEVGAKEGDIKHEFPLYSLDKVYVGEALKLQEYELVETPKLDGLAVALLYDKGILVKAATRGDGKTGRDILDKVMHLDSIPNNIDYPTKIQITGEVVCDKTIENARNFAAGAIGSNTSIKKFKEQEKHLSFVAYGVSHKGWGSYKLSMIAVENLGFTTVLKEGLTDKYRTDGKVFRVNDNKAFEELGYTAKHPRGAFALKDKADVEVVETTLNSVEWQVGGSGRVTPVGHFDEVIIDDAKITKATLNNPGYIENLGLSLGDTILVTRAGGVIPQIVGVK